MLKEFFTRFQKNGMKLMIKRKAYILMSSSTKDGAILEERLKRNPLIRCWPKQKIWAPNGICCTKLFHCTDGNTVFVNL